MRQKSILGDDEYGGRISRSVSQMEHDEQNGMNPEVIGKYIANIVKKKKPAIVYVASVQYKFLSLLCKILPAAVREKIVEKNIWVKLYSCSSSGSPSGSWKKVIFFPV